MKSSLIFLIGTALLVSGCKEHPARADLITFKFIVVDSQDNDLFFSDSSSLDPYEVLGRQENSTWAATGDLHLVADSLYFLLGGFPNLKRVYYMQFIPDRIDTISFSPTDNYSSLLDHYDVRFNSTSICTDCKKTNVYKLKIDD